MSYWSDRADASFARAQDDYERAEPTWLADDEEDDELEDDDDDEEDLSGCPYYRDRDRGVCDSGCHSEPACVTGEPVGGWPSLHAQED